jgi:hypothetical protein
MDRRSALFFLLFLTPATIAHSEIPVPLPVVDGYVTREGPLTDFDADGFHILSTKKTKAHMEGTPIDDSVDIGAIYFGESVSVFGKLERAKHRIIATEIIFHPVNQKPVGGFAIIDRVLSPAKSGGGPGRLIVRADGYVILINSTTKIRFQVPLTSLPNVSTNTWIKYHGKPQADGILVADNATFAPNAILNGEARLLDRNDYDPKTVDPNAKQNIARELVLGRDPKKIPPYKDDALQARIDRIGASLIPAYQRQLPESDLTKILFHFQLIDDHKMKDALALPSGIILIPFQIVNRLQNDSQVATVLADNIACVLEKQTYRAKPGQTTMIVAEVASIAGPLGAFTTTTIANSLVASSDKKNAEDQSGRVSLGLLHDAGYDIGQAPIAWWLLAADTADKLPSTPIPRRAANLYKSIGSTWHNYSEASDASTTLQTK